MNELQIGERVIVDTGMHRQPGTICDIVVDLFGGTRIYVEANYGPDFWMTAEMISPSLDGQHRLVTGRHVPAPD